MGAWTRALAGLAALALGPTLAQAGATAEPTAEGLRLLWSAPGLREARSAYCVTPARGGTVLLRANDASMALVALDIHTGRERWRVPMPTEGEPQISLAGQLALVQRPIGVTAVDLSTGQQRWTRRLCAFRGDLETDAGSHVGVGTCGVPDPPGDSRWHPWKIAAVAVDLTNGRELWRRETTTPHQALVASAGRFYLAVGDTPYPNQLKQRGVTVFALDPRTGKVLRQFPLAQDPDHVQLFPSDPTRALFIGDDIAAVDLTDGRVLWRQPAPLPMIGGSQPAPRTDLRDGRLVVAYESQVRELELRSGAPITSWDIPWTKPDARQPVRQMVRPTPPGGALLIKDAWNKPAFAFQYAKPGAAPRVVQLEVNYDQVLAIEDGVVVVVEGSGGVRGYAAF